MKSAFAVVLGLFFLVLGLQMLMDPAGWYRATPGVPATGPFNAHFVTDIALAFVASGALWLATLIFPAQRAGLAIGACLWPALHAAFHLVEWGERGPPTGSALWTEGLGVIAVAALSLVLAIFLFRPKTK